MEYAAVAGFLAVVLLLVQRMLTRARVDNVISDLRPDVSKQQKEQHEIDAAKITQEIQNADIRYSNAKRAVQSPPSKGE